MHTFRFPGETAEYRTQRDALLEAERDLRRRVEEVAAMRRRLPLGGRVTEDYGFEEADPERDGATRTTRMSALFAPGKDTLVLYSFMFGPNMARACPMCTSFTDGLDGNARHVQERVNLAVVARSPVARFRELARSRGWRNLRLLSSAESSFNRDYHAETPEGKQNSIIHTFVRREDGIRHAYSSELNMLPSDPGQNPRHIDLMWPLWNVLDLTPEGRGADFYPALEYR
jgi:predicted dithiol-disulfide oxidoreductase (DUF899 family)